ncbi:MAG: restriction endonuclease subunit S [Thermoguttaceae bacterium]|nr:restriction endonuclease subunit S [Thermoguttaceae bacterium]
MTMNKNKPRVRFKGFDGEWERRKMRDIAEVNPKDELPELFEYVDLESVVGIEMVTHRTETRLSAPSRAQRLARKGDLFYQTVRPYQKNNYLFEDGSKHYVFSTGYAQLRPRCDGYFLLALVQDSRFVISVLTLCTGTSYPAISATDLVDVEVIMPKGLPEQAAIGVFFRKLDSLITLYEQELEKLKQIKLAMLERMFV